MRILTLLGESDSSRSARELSYRLARSTGAEVAGLAGVDLEFVEIRMLGGIGVAAFQVRLGETLKQQAIERRFRLRELYEQECLASGVSFNWLSFEGDPIESIRLAAETRDLIVTGHDTAFGGAPREAIAEVLTKLLLLSPRPAIVCGEACPQTKDVLVAYDGSVAAMRALQVYILLGLASGARVHLTSIASDSELAVRRVRAAAEFLRGHAIEAEAVPIATAVDPAEAIRIEVADRAIGIVVMGCYGHGGWRSALFGSTTTQLVERPPCPLFLFH